MPPLGMMSSEPKQLLAFLAAVARDPGGVGALVPTAAEAARQLAAVVPGRGEPLVVELGPGTGPVSAQVQRRLCGRGRHLAVERDPGLAGFVARAHPGVEVVVDDAAELARILDERGIGSAGVADAVVSALPWSLIPAAQQRTIVEATACALRPGAAFSTIAYLPGLPTAGGKRFASLLGEVFDEVLTTRPVWQNIPPAVTYVCRRPRT